MIKTKSMLELVWSLLGCAGAESRSVGRVWPRGRVPISRVEHVSRCFVKSLEAAGKTFLALKEGGVGMLTCRESLI
jgi:hypothetical protein